MSRLALFGKEGALRYLGGCDFNAINPDIWERYRRNAVRYLQARGAKPDILSTLDLPFSCEWIFYIGDFGETSDTQEQVLVLRVPVEVFVEIEREAGNWDHRIAQSIPEAVHALNRVGCNIKYVVAEIELDADNKPIEILNVEELKITSATVEHALSQARTLILSHGAPAALDRIHTVFHGYLKVACENAKIPIPNDRPGIIELLGLLRKHSVFVFEPELESLVTQTLRGAQKSIDALETFRNNHSLAHPQDMLPEPEALLVINLTQAILRYIDARLQ
jgi:hypothetical protein